MKKIILPVFTSIFASAALFAVTATTSGDWSNPEIWDGGAVPTEEDEVKFAEGVAVDLTTEATINNFGYNDGYNTPAVLNITGADASLNVLSGSNWYYRYMLEVNVTDGANLTVADGKNISWGGGGYYKINLDNASASLSFGQLQGSKFTNAEGEYDSGIYLSNGSTWTGNIYLHPESADHYMTLSLTGGSSVVGTVSASAAASNSVVNLLIDNATVNGFGNFTASGEGAKSNATISNVSLSGNATLSASGAESVVDFKITDGAKLNFTAGGIAASGENATVNVLVSGGSIGQSAASSWRTTGDGSVINVTVNGTGAIKNTNGDFFISSSGYEASTNVLIDSASTKSEFNNVYMVSEKFGSLSIVLKDTELTSKYFWFGTGSYSAGNNDNRDTYSDGTNRFVVYNSLFDSNNFRLKYYDWVDTTMEVFGDSTVTLTNSVYIGNKTVAKDDTWGSTTLQFGGYYDDEFVAAKEASLSGSYEFWVYSSATLKFILGDSNLTKVGEETKDAIFSARYLKPIQGLLVLDLTNIENLEAGEYMVALFKCTSGQSMTNIGGVTADYNELLVESAIETEFAQLMQNENGDYYEIKNNILYAYIQVVPEPATYAAIFGALALAFVAYRRRK